MLTSMEAQVGLRYQRQKLKKKKDIELYYFLE